MLYQINQGDRNNETESQGKSGREIIGLNSPWGSRGEICKNFGWTYDYLLWGISWINVQTMLADAAKIKDLPDENGEDGGTGEINRRIDTKEEFEQYINSLM